MQTALRSAYFVPTSARSTSGSGEIYWRLVMETETDYIRYIGDVPSLTQVPIDRSSSAFAPVAQACITYRM